MEEKFGAVVVAGIAVFGLIFVMNQTGSGDGILTMQEPKEKVTIYEEKIGKVGESNPDFRYINLGDFNVGKTRGDIRGYYNSEITVRDKLFSENKLKFSYNAKSPKEANLTFYVLGRQNQGRVYLKANGENVFEEALVTSGSPKITVPEEYLKPGENSFELGVRRQGLFTESEYLLEDVELRVNDRKFHNHVQNFKIFEYELEDYSDSELEFDITRSIKTSPLEIYVNDNQVYSKEQVRISPEEVNINPDNAGLTPGNNRIEFRTKDEARYDIENARISINYLGNVESQNVVLDFDINSSRMNFIKREDTEEKVIMDYQNLLPFPRDLEVHINDYNKTITPENGQNTINIEEGALEDLNRMEIRSNGTYKLRSIKLVSEKVEEE